MNLYTYFSACLTATASFSWFISIRILRATIIFGVILLLGSLAILSIPLIAINQPERTKGAEHLDLAHHGAHDH